MNQFESAFVAPVVGRLFDRVGTRKLAFFGVAAISLGFVVLSQASSYFGFVAAVLVLSAGYSCAFTANTMATVSRWFVRRRTTALGLVMAGSGLGGLLVPLLALLIEGSGWRTAALVVGAVLFVVGMPMVGIMRSNPECCGLQPDGECSTSGELARMTPRVAPEREMDTRQALRTRAFWLLTIATSLSTTAQTAIVVHAIPYLTGIGMAAAIAASAVGAISVISVAGRIGFGWVGDRAPKRLVLAVVLSLQVAGLAVFAGINQPWQVIPFLALFAPGYGGAYPLRPSIQAEYFGRRSFGAIQGVLLAANSFAGMFGPIFLGWMFDSLGSYRVALWCIAGLVALAVPAVLLMPKPPQASAAEVRA